VSRNLYTRDEVVLCTYAARFEGHDIGGVEAIRRLCGRSALSITAKIQNIAAMLDEHGIPRDNRIAPLTGRPAGETGRLTNWDWVEPLAHMPRADLLRECERILVAGEIEPLG
jgi:hypothetical protein